MTSVADGKALLDTGKAEIAVAGRSNVGKSSFINFLCNNGKLARTSSEPGRTRLLNYFEINGGEFFIVDLPGYGYAKVAKGEKEKWGSMIEGYLTGSQNLKNVFVLLDSRHEPTDDDKMLVNFLFSYQIPFTIIATKADKLSRQEQQKSKQMIASTMGVGVGNVIMTSSVAKSGKDEVLARIEQILA
ncbi:MAG: ribosome biogenesis GTP-binding protein YihA/YsxC [Clostridia bacterium]|nr:ribosome biogenesis GTP-binding protein YihA/YsxC [Clostridia bacterium]